MYTSDPLGFLTWQICVCLSVCGIADVIGGSALCSSLMDNLVSGASFRFNSTRSFCPPSHLNHLSSAVFLLCVQLGHP